MATSKDSRNHTAARSSLDDPEEVERLRAKLRNFLCRLGLVRCSITICALVLESADPESRADLAHFLRWDARNRLDEELAAAKVLLSEFRPEQALSRRPIVTE